MRSSLVGFAVALVVGLTAGCGSSALPPGGTGGAPGTGGSSGGTAGSTPGSGGASGGTGGTARGGSGGALGGHGGSAGAGGGASGGAAGSHAECAQASDCVLHNDCCACEAVPKTASIASCNIECLVSDCEAHRITNPDVACVAGRCVLALSCDATHIACTVAQPSCPAGSLPAVSGSCYTGACLPVAQCSEVASCDACTAAGLACVTDQALGGSPHHCVTIPAACSAAPTCGCLGVCTGGFQCADPASTTLVCQCPAC